MKTPRLDAFVAPDKLRELSSPLDGMPKIQPPGARSSGESSNSRIREKEEARKGGNEDSRTAQVAHHGVVPLDIAILGQRGDEKYGVEFTEVERDALDDLKKALRRNHGLKVSKNTLIRFTVYVLLNDYCKKGDKSIVFTQLEAVLRKEP